MAETKNIITIRKQDTSCANRAFAHLMTKTQRMLNKRGKESPNFFKKISVAVFEQESLKMIKEACTETPFDPNEVILTPKHNFPDIVANTYYGVEIKLTEKDKWTSTGSSIVESTRCKNIENIYLLFAKLGGKKPEFLCRPYEEVQCEITVTHSPRYLINMKLRKGESIFDKMDIPYNSLRVSPDLVARVRNYYKDQASRKGKTEMPWLSKDDETPIGMNLRLWKDLPLRDRKYLLAQLLLLFPKDIVHGEFNRPALWLCATRSIVNPHIRDVFTAGGKLHYINGQKLPSPVSRIIKTVVDTAPFVRSYLALENDMHLFYEEHNPYLLTEDGKNTFDLWKNQIATLIEEEHKLDKIVEWIDQGSILTVK